MAPAEEGAISALASAMEVRRSGPPIAVEPLVLSIARRGPPVSLVD
jgi:hypothetical protein